MADIKISELQETQSLDNFYVPGVKEDVSGNLESRKFGLSEFQEKVNKSINAIQNNIETFNSSRNYYKGEYVIYNNTVWKFVNNHTGSWSENDVIQVSVFSELENLMTPEKETVIINVSSVDNLLDVSTVTVTLNLSDGTTLQETCNSSGNCSFLVNTGLDYTIIMPEKANYQIIGDVTYTAEIPTRYINLVYQKSLDIQTCDVSINFNVYNGGDISDFNNLTCSLSTGSTVLTPQTITNGVATFSGLTRGVSYSTSIPSNTNYVKPSNKTFIAYSNSDINFYYKHISPDGFGIFLVYTINNGEELEYREIELTALYDENDQWIGGEQYGITGNNSIAIHVYPEVLANNGCDYFVKLSDLCSRTTKQFLKNDIKLQHVPGGGNINTLLSNYYDGKLYTNYMIYDSVTLNNSSSPTADWVITQTFQYKGQTLSGFIGSGSQLNFILPKDYPDNKNNIYKVLTSLDFTPNYVAASLCASIQYNKNSTWFWKSTGWSVLGHNSGTYQILPLYTTTI